MSDLWGSVPQVRWSRAESNEEPKRSEPSVVANAAKATNITAEAAATGNSIQASNDRTPDRNNRESGSVPAKGQQRDGAADEPKAPLGADSTASHDAADRSAVGDAGEMTASGSIPAGSTDDNIESLKAGLDDDAQRAKEPPHQFGGAHDVRVRVESLLERSKHLFATGRLREARHTAQIAHDLGESARLDFSPDEERPVDLVHRIDDQIEASSRADLVRPKELLNAEPGARTEGNVPRNSAAPDEPTRNPAGHDDSANRSHSRRDWSYGLNVFRRDRKSGSADPAAVAPATSSPVAASPVDVQLGLEVESEAKVETHTAVVQANRSISLAGNSPASEERPTSRPRYESAAPISYVPGPNTVQEESIERVTTSRSTLSEADLPSDSSWPRDNTDDGRRLVMEDEVTPPEVDEVRPIAEFHDVARQRSAERTELFNSPKTEDGAPWGWIAGLVAFGICGIFAVFCYRRGAT